MSEVVLMMALSNAHAYLSDSILILTHVVIANQVVQKVNKSWRAWGQGYNYSAECPHFGTVYSIDTK